MLIKKKFQLAAVMLVCFVLLVGGLKYLQKEILQKNLKRHDMIITFASEIYDLNFITYDYLQEKSERAVMQWRRQYLYLGTHISQTKEVFPVAPSLFVKMKYNYESLGDIFTKLHDDSSDSPSGNENLRAERQKRFSAQMLIRSRALYSQSKKMIDASSQSMAKKQDQIALLVFCFVIFFAFILVGFMLYIGIPLYPRIANLRKGFSEVADGKLDHFIDVKPGDEFSQVEDSFNKTISRLAQITVSREKLENEKVVRLKSQRRLEQLERSLRLMTDSVFMFTGMNGKIFYANLGAEQMLGYMEEEFKNLSLFDLMEEKDRDTVRLFLKSASSERDRQNYEFDLCGLQNQVIPVEINIQYVVLEEDQNYCIAIARNITHRKAYERKLLNMQEELEKRVTKRTAALQDRVKETEHLNRAMINLLDDLQNSNIKLETISEQLQYSNKELEAFSYSVSHDLRAPLRHINGYVDLLNNRFSEDLPDKARHYLDTITDSSNKMGALIDDLLQFSRTGRQEMRLVAMDMNILVQEVLENLKPDIINRNISWTVAELPEVFGDYPLLKQVWSNLLDNAVKFTLNKGEAEIEIGYTQESNHWVFFVRDNGAGFDMQYANKLFGVFQRLHSPADFEGTGIGLANVQRIVHKHAGRVWAEAQPDKGATFYFTLPCEPRKSGDKL